MDEEGMTTNVTDGMERAALSVHMIHQWLTFLQMPVVTAAQQHKQQITIRLHKVELGIISKFWK
jgi:hypothetical protein